MSFPTTEVINAWFQDAHTTAVKAGGSVYVMEKRAEHEVVSGVLRWAYLTMLDELEDLNYPTSSRVRIRVYEMLDELYTTDGVDDTEDDELVDDYNDEANTTEKMRITADGTILLFDEDEDEDEESSTEIEPTLALEVINALIKALIDKK
jgi:hypothetical protein